MWPNAEIDIKDYDSVWMNLIVHESHKGESTLGYFIVDKPSGKAFWSVFCNDWLIVQTFNVS